MKITNLVLSAFTICMGTCGMAAAQTAGTVMIKGGYNHFYPQVKSDDISGVPGAKIDVGKAGDVFGSIAYMLTDNIATELMLGVPPNQDIYGSGTIAAAGKIASADVLPPALSIQYRFFEAKSAFRPYVGLGIIRAMFRNVKGTPTLTALTNPGGPETTVSIDSMWGMSAQVGVSYALNDKWFIDGAVIPMFIKTTARLSTGQTVDTKINPIVVNLSVGYRF